MWCLSVVLLELALSLRPEHMLWSSDDELELLEKENIQALSFVPSQEEVAGLVEQSQKAEARRKELLGSEECDPLLSKAYGIDKKFLGGLCPKSKNPDETILVKLGRKGSIGDPEKMGSFINDRGMPLGSTSNGPNFVLTQCNGAYACEEQPRMNLFCGSEAQVMLLLTDFMDLREKNEAAIFQMYVEKLKEHSKTFKFDLGKDATEKNLLSPELHKDYLNTVSLFEKVSKALGEKSIGDFGLKMNSYCQTWLKKGEAVGEASFSVMSPHFQTRIYVEHAQRLDAAGVTHEEKQSYMALITHFTQIMIKEGYGEPAAFVNLDGLSRQYAQKSA